MQCQLFCSIWLVVFYTVACNIDNNVWMNGKQSSSILCWWNCTTCIRLRCMLNVCLVNTDSTILHSRINSDMWCWVRASPYKGKGATLQLCMTDNDYWHESACRVQECISPPLALLPVTMLITDYIIINGHVSRRRDSWYVMRCTSVQVCHIYLACIHVYTSSLVFPQPMSW